MRLCTWNIWSKGSSLREKHWLEAAKELESWGVDVVALQEVDRNWGDRSQHADVSGEMADHLGFHCFYCPSIEKDGGQYGNAILSRWQPIETGRAELSPQIEWDTANHETEPRTAAWIRLEIPQKMIVIGVHLANAIEFASTPITGIQANRLKKLVKELSEAHPDHQIVLCGDFNLPAEAREIIELGQAIPLIEQPLPTWPVQQFEYKGWVEDPPPRFTVDHIFSNQPLRVWLEESEVSDHLPVLADTP